jgi:hypothetical protein
MTRLSRAPAVVPSHPHYLQAATTTSSSESQRPIESQSQHRGLGQKNVVNIANAALPVHTKVSLNISYLHVKMLMVNQGFISDNSLRVKPSLKRQGSNPSNEPPMKTRARDRLPVDRDDNVYMRRDIASIKKTLEDMADEAKEDIASIKESIEEIYYEAREERDNINNMLADILAEIQHKD